MAERYYRMSSLRRLEAAGHKLADEPNMSTSRLLGYANRYVLRVEHADGEDPDPIVRDIDPEVRVLPGPPPGDEPVGVGDLVQT
ncbi:MAG: hypothetical protein ACRDPQ_08445 [Nocardioidaceae bacterium]